jgi:hypothetical protein
MGWETVELRGMRVLLPFRNLFVKKLILVAAPPKATI